MKKQLINPEIDFMELQLEENVMATFASGEIGVTENMTYFDEGDLQNDYRFWKGSERF